jgi:hypothetical protein
VSKNQLSKMLCESLSPTVAGGIRQASKSVWPTDVGFIVLKMLWVWLYSF